MTNPIETAQKIKEENKTWKPCNTMENLAKAIDNLNKKNKNKILMDYTIRGFCVMENFTLHFPNENNNRRFKIIYHYSRNFWERLLYLFKPQEGYYEIYTEQEGY